MSVLGQFALIDFSAYYGLYFPACLHAWNSGFFFFFKFSPKDTFSLLLGREEGRQGGRERDIDTREKPQSAASRTCSDGGP